MAVLQALSAKLAAAPSIIQFLGQRPPAGGNPADTGVFISLAVKQALRPYLVLHMISAPPAEATLDGISSLVQAEIQIDSYGDDPVTARQVSKAVKALLANFSGALNDGTTIQFTDVPMDADEPYETGGGGYLYRSLLRLEAFYTEQGT